MFHQVQTWRTMFTDASRKRTMCTITCTITRAAVVYQQIVHGNIANQILGFTIDYGKFILKKKNVSTAPCHHSQIQIKNFSQVHNIVKCSCEGLSVYDQ